MPKERFHLLLADECFSRLGKLHPETLRDGSLREACLLGSIMPDVFFYDAPSFALAATGRAVHRLEGEPGFELICRMLEENGAHLSRATRFWMFGFASHCLADGFWHPAIRSYSAPSSRLCRRLAISSKSCHFWVESQMEALWLPMLGPPDGHRATLGAFRRRRAEYGEYFLCYRQLLQRASVRRPPSVASIRRCLFYQTVMLQVFTHPGCAALQMRLSGKLGIGAPLGPLMAPDRPAPQFLEACRLQRERGGENLCGAQMLSASLSYMFDRLQTLPV
ncbi:MAG: zinc dependent phospholipase C family protein [Syntrophobacteraceae bacterium]